MSWVKQSLGLASFAFINLVLFITISTPFNQIIYMTEDAANDTLDADVLANNIHPFYGYLRMIFGLCFTFSMIGLILGFFLVSHRNEYEEYPRGPYGQ
jgi:hypothetical protein